MIVHTTLLKHAHDLPYSNHAILTKWFAALVDSCYLTDKLRNLWCTLVAEVRSYVYKTRTTQTKHEKKNKKRQTEILLLLLFLSVSSCLSISSIFIRCISFFEFSVSLVDIETVGQIRNTLTCPLMLFWKTWHDAPLNGSLWLIQEMWTNTCAHVVRYLVFFKYERTRNFLLFYLNSFIV